eukprot:scaffold252521_cov34-Prasinocladus_malaysianus.AAC.1
MVPPYLSEFMCYVHSCTEVMSISGQSFIMTVFAILFAVALCTMLHTLRSIAAVTFNTSGNVNGFWAYWNF